MKISAQKGFIAIIPVVIIFMILVAAGGYIYFRTDLLKSSKNFAESEKITKEDQKVLKEINDWKSYNFNFGQVSIKYPNNWLVKTSYSGPSDYKFVDFFPTTDDSVISSDPVISFGISLTYDNTPEYASTETVVDSSMQKMPAPPPPVYYPPQKEKNFTIPALGEKENATFEQQQDITSISFEKNGVSYTLTANMYQALQQKRDPAEITATLTKMAKSIQFIEVADSCDDQILKPLTDFPNNFLLTNRHLSDKTDRVQGYFPDVTSTDPYIQENAKTMIDRVFITKYIKEGAPFKSDEEFLKTVVEIEGSRDLWTADKTGLMYVNCAGESMPKVASQLHYIGHQGKPFQVEIYGSSSNPQNLWAIPEWNTNILKKARGTVYIKRGDMWQKYSAKDFYVTL